MSITVHCVGAWTGVLEVETDSTTLADLKATLKAASGLPEQMKLIVAGKQLREEGGKSLQSLGLKHNSKILIMCTLPAKAQQLQQQEQTAQEADDRTARLQRLKEAAASLARRETRYGSDNAYEFALENQSGEMLKLSKPDREAVVMALILHERAKKKLQLEQYTEALPELLLAEEAANLCTDDLLKSTDNVGILLLDIVWCYFMLQDQSKLAEAHDRLQHARKRLQQSYGKELERARVLYGNFRPELSLFVRLETLEGISAYYRSDWAAARALLHSAHDKWQQLQVDDTSLALLASMGFSAKLGKRALRMCGGDVEKAADFATQQLQDRENRRTKAQQEKNARRQQRRLGRTLDGQALDVAALAQLASLSFPEALGAAALRQSNNSMQGALDLLSNPTTNEALQSDLLAYSSHDGDGTAANTPRASTRPTGSRPSGDAAATDPGPSGTDPEGAGARDEEMEAELVHSVSGDPLAAFDVEVHAEGQAIQQYLAMLQAARSPTSH
ncbi:hypothetical protein WJX73_006601 [Symbiochloris irregularis]|uniref:NEDD8 ultimate buster 1 n=1 Tax=Symbiochloris irregularis TaxID=706552 RepID=A0AAW1P415_9CHLO